MRGIFPRHNAGNTLTDESGYIYTYDAWNRLTKINMPDHPHIEYFTYDALGRQMTSYDALLPDLGPAALIVNNGNPFQTDANHGN